MAQPNVVIMAGPNGAGKSTLAPALVLETLGVHHYVNADTLARGLSAFDVDEMAFKAGKIMLEHLHDLANERANFGFETTLASRTFAPWIAELKRTGYRFHVFFVWVASAEVSISRVRERVMLGGHGVPEETIRRRYERSVVSFFQFYQPIADSWCFFDNNNPREPQLIARGNGTSELVVKEALWHSIKTQANKLTPEPGISVPDILKDEARVQKALRAAVQKAIRFHKMMGRPIIVWQDGKVVTIPPEEIELLDEPS